ncbi:MAG: gluconate 2-dehydrogenase subunit 3 family protein [Candidatus Sulfotelmatobacter sp.]|jgi:gluconate 2-dehydrogenase gamma chain
MSISRRDILKSLTLTALSGSVLRVIPLEAAEYAHHMVKAEKAAADNQAYTPKFFSAHDYETLQSLCQTIIPSDAGAKGAIEAGAPEFIDLITSENKDYQLALGGGIMWLDNTCLDRYGSAYLESTAAQQKEILDLIAYRKNAKTDPSLGQGIQFFSFLRKLTADGFFTSEIGFDYLGYIGNTYLQEFPGCPPVPET